MKHSVDTVDTVLAQLPDVLQKHPGIGLSGGVGAGALYWIEITGPVLSFIGVILGVGIAAITLHLKIIEWKEKRNNRTNK